MKKTMPEWKCANTGASMFILMVEWTILLGLSCMFLCLSCESASAGRPEEGWVSFDGVTTSPAAARVEVISSSLSEVILRLTVPGMLVERIVHEGDEYDRLELPGYKYSGAVGHPAMPAVRHLVAVPKGCDVSVSAVLLDSLLFSDVLVYPVEDLVTRYTNEGWSYLAEEFAKDPAAYSTSDRSPWLAAEVEEVASLRGQGVARVALAPIQFTPSTGELRITPSMLVTLTITGGSGTTSEELGPFSDIAARLVLGYGGAGAIGWRGPGENGSWGVKRSLAGCDSLGVDYLMIVEGSLMGSHALRTLAAHRTTYNGWNVAIVPDTTVADATGGGTISAQAIHDFIQDVYELGNAEHMADGRLGYVLLVGDARAGEPHFLLPAKELPYGLLNSMCTTDHLYACVDEDDLLPDLSIGRMCVSDTLELLEEASRTIDYEVGAVSAETWRSRALFACGFAWFECDAIDEDMAAGAHAAFALAGTYLDEAGILTQEIHAHELLPPAHCVVQYGRMNPLLIDAVNGGARFVQMCTHGAIHECNGLEHGRVPEFTNADSLAFWMSYSCMTGAYDLPSENPSTPWDCLGENLMHETDLGGAVAFFGSSENAGAPWRDVGTYLWEGMFDHDHHRVGEAIGFAKIKFLSLIDTEPLTLANINFVRFNLLGDPALDLFLTDTGSAGYASAPDYAIDEDDLSTDPPFPNVGAEVALLAEIHNESNYVPDGPVDVAFEVREVGGGSTIFSDTAQVAPGTWSSETASVTWTPTLAHLGHVEVSVIVTPTTGPAELDTENNTACRPICT